MPFTDLIEAQRRTEQQIVALTEAQRKTNYRLDTLTNDMAEVKDILFSSGTGSGWPASRH